MNRLSIRYLLNPISAIVRRGLTPIFCGIATFLVAPQAFAESASLSVFSQASRDYRSALKARDDHQAIPYAISFELAADFTSDKDVKSSVFAENLSESLVQQLSLKGFELASDSESAEQLLVVHAGTTDAARDASISIGDYAHANVDESLQFGYKSALLGYTRAYQEARELVGMSLGQTMQQDLSSDLQAPRNYLVVTAYDFDRVQQHGGRESAVLWRTHVSVKASATPFADKVGTLVTTGSGFFGKNSRGLVRRFRSEVIIGPIEVTESDVKAP
jgi:hypothetical protein